LAQVTLLKPTALHFIDLLSADFPNLWRPFTSAQR